MKLHGDRVSIWSLYDFMMWDVVGFVEVRLSALVVFGDSDSAVCTKRGIRDACPLRGRRQSPSRAHCLSPPLQGQASGQRPTFCCHLVYGSRLTFGPNKIRFEILVFIVTALPGYQNFARQAKIKNYI